MKKKEQALKTRAKILKSALKVFLKRGYSNSSLNEIATIAGVTRGAVYWHFKNKREILNELNVGQFQRLKDKTEEIMGESISHYEQLRKILFINVEALYELKEFRDYIELTWFNVEKSQYPELVTSKRSINESYYETFADLIDKSKKNGELAVHIDSNITALNLLNLVNGIFRSYFLFSSKFKEKKVALTSVDQYLKFIKK